LIAPTALHAHGIAKGKTVTSHPSVKDKLDGEYNFLTLFYMYKIIVIASQL